MKRSSLFAVLTLLLMPTLTHAAEATLITAPRTGASLAWTSGDPTVSAARALIAKGQLADATALLLAAPKGADAAAVDETIETIRRIRRDYALTPEAMLAKLKPRLKSVSAADVEWWRTSGELQYRTIDGRPAFFIREPSNLFRFCPDAIARKVETPVKADGFSLNSHLADVVREAEATGQPAVHPIRFEIQYTLTVPASAKGARAGSVIRAWLPFPQEYRQQSDVALISTTPSNPITSENGSPHRTLYFEQTIDDPAKPTVFKASFAYTSRAYYPLLDDAKVQPLPTDFDRAYLAERLPHVHFSPRLKEIVKQVCGEEPNPLVRARKLFAWVDGNIKYHAEEEYAILPSFSDLCLARGRGDCGVQATTFVTLCRAAGVPARWQSGWQTLPGGRHNMHDWSEIYVAPWGWIPTDASNGLQKSDDPKVREFFFGHQDSHRLIVNLDYGHPLTPAKKSLRSEPADFQRGEVEVDGRNLYYDEFDYDFDFSASAVEAKR